MIKNIFKLMRPKHYIKNLLIFVSLVFTLRLFNINDIIVTLEGFAAFCLMSSVVYILNDVADVQKDRLHDVKRHRPIASGAVSVRCSYILAFILFIGSLLLDYLAAGFGLSTLFLVVYLFLNIVYSRGLKNIPLLDILILVSGFLLRILYGAALIDASVSSWLYLTVMSASFYMGLGKRRNEIKKLGETHASKVRGVLKHYNHAFLDKNMYMSMALAIVFYSLWSVDPATVLRYGTSNLVWTVPLIIVMAMKYSLNIEMAVYADPVEVIMSDKVLMALVALYAVLLIGIVYWHKISLVF